MKVQTRPNWTGLTLMVGFCCLGGWHPGIAAESTDRILTTAAAVRSLSPAEAERHYPVKLHGVVTFYDETIFSRFVQDETAGIYLGELTNMPALLPGQVVEVEGVTGPGEYAPVVVPTAVKVVGEGEIPAAKPVSFEDLVSGHEDSQMVEFGGIVRAVRFEKQSKYFVVDLVMGGERFTVYAKQLPVDQANALVDSTVKVRGVGSTMFNHQRQMFGIRLLVPKADGLVIEEPAPANSYDLPVQNINSLLQFAPQGTLGHRVKMKGTVVYCEPGSAVFIQDENAGLHCQTMQRDVVQRGDQVEVLGFPAKGEYSPILEDVIYRKVGVGTEPKADAVDLNEVLTGAHDCRLVQLQAKVLERVQRGVNQFLLLQTGDFTFRAYLPQSGSGDGLAATRNGSEVMATGICIIERGNNWQAGKQWRAASFRLLLRSPKDVVVLQSPPAWTLPDGLWIAGAFGVVALGALSWVIVLKKELRQQTSMMQKASLAQPGAASPDCSPTHPTKA